MNKKITFFTFAAVLMAFSFLFVSCPSGLEPSWKNADKPVFTLDFSTSFGDSGASRAIVQGGGFLYIRTIGSSSGPAGALYGPFLVSAGSVFSTTDIPAGKYVGFGVIYALQKPDPSKKRSWNNKEYTFIEFLNLPDADFMAATDSGEEGTEFPMEDFFDSDVSGNMVEDVTIVAGKENTVELTLEPMVSDANWGSFEQGYNELSFGPVSSRSLKKQFFALENVPSGNFSFSINSEVTPTIGRTALYDFQGALLKSWASGVDKREHSLSNDVQNERLYFYIEYSGTFELSFFVEPIVESEGNFEFFGDSQTANKTFLFFLSPVPTGQEYPEPVAFGLVHLNAEGAGSATPYSVTGGTYTIEANTKYCVEGFVDMSGSYSSLTTSDLMVQIGSIEPLTGDLILSDDPLFSVTSNSEGVISIKNPPLIAYERELVMFFVSENGTGNGETPASPSSWAALQTKISSMPPGEAAFMQVFVTENMNVSTPLIIKSNISVFISSSGPTHTITYSGTGAPFVSVLEGSFGLSGIILSGVSGNTLPGSPIQVLSSMESPSYIMLGEGAKIQNFHVEGNGGAIALSDNTFFSCSGGEISNCSATKGGAIYAGSGSLIIWEEGIMTGNTATEAGGGIYLEYGASLYEGETINPSTLTGVTGNTVNGVELNIVFGEGLLVAFNGQGDPVITGTLSNLTMNSSISVSAPGGYDTYSWMVNSNPIEAATSNTFTFTPSLLIEGQIQIPVSIGQNWIQLIVVKDDEIFSAAVEFVIEEGV